VFHPLLLDTSPNRLSSLVRAPSGPRRNPALDCAIEHGTSPVPCDSAKCRTRPQLCREPGTGRNDTPKTRIFGRERSVPPADACARSWHTRVTRVEPKPASSCAAWAGPGPRWQRRAVPRGNARARGVTRSRTRSHQQRSNEAEVTCPLVARCRAAAPPRSLRRTVCAHRRARRRTAPDACVTERRPILCYPPATTADDARMQLPNGMRCRADTIFMARGAPASRGSDCVLKSPALPASALQPGVPIGHRFELQGHCASRPGRALKTY
jgi:hypothetical protein